MSPTEQNDLERSVLGAVLVTPELLGPAADAVMPEDFAAQAHRAAWTALLRLDEDGRPRDLVTLRAELAELGQLEAAGGAAYLAGLTDGVPRVGDAAVAAWAAKIREAGRLRRLAGSLRVLLSQADAGTVTADELHGSVERLLCDAAAPSAAVLDRDSVAAASWRAIEAEVRGEAQGIGTGLPDLDRRLRCGGWRPGQLVLVGARTSRGKSSLLLGFGEAAAAKGLRVLFATLEMTPEELNSKRLVADAGVSLNALHSWRSADRGRVLEALNSARPILSRPLDYTGPSVRTLGQIRAACRRQEQRQGLDLVCIDYLQMVRLEGAGKASLYERTTLISQGLKGLAMDLEVPVLCAAQLNREPAGQNVKAGRPSLAHFRDSGSLEQDCDIALLIHQEGTRDAIGDGDCEVIVAKQRNGWTGAVPVRWRAACARFESPAFDSQRDTA